MALVLSSDYPWANSSAASSAGWTVNDTSIAVINYQYDGSKGVESYGVNNPGAASPSSLSLISSFTPSPMRTLETYFFLDESDSPLSAGQFGQVYTQFSLTAGSGRTVSASIGVNINWDSGSSTHVPEYVASMFYYDGSGFPVNQNAFLPSLPTGGRMRVTNDGDLALDCWYGSSWVEEIAPQSGYDDDQSYSQFIHNISGGGGGSWSTHGIHIGVILDWTPKETGPGGGGEGWDYYNPNLTGSKKSNSTRFWA
jgi:hypothetical protein